MCGQEALELGSWRKTVIKREQTVVITAVKEVLRLSGCEPGLPGLPAVRESLPSWRRIRGLSRLEAPPLIPDTHREKGFAKISITVCPSNRYQSDP